MRFKKLLTNETASSKSYKTSNVSTAQIANKVFYIAIPMLLCLSLIFSLYNSQKAIEASERLKATNEALIAINEQQKKDLEILRGDTRQLTDTILCLGEFFNREDRAKSKMTSYSPCTIEPIDSTQPAASLILQSSPQADSSVRNVESSSPQPTTPTQTPQPDNSQPPQETGVVEGVVMSIMSFIRGLF